MNQYELEYLNPALLVDYPLNAKKHTEAQIQALAKEIGDVGFRVPIVVDHEGVIISGHGRKQAAILAGLDAVPVHRLPADFDPARIRAMRLFDNKIADTGIDEKLLRQELSELVSLDGFDFSWTGFESSILNEPLFEPNLPDAEDKPSPEQKYELRISFEDEDSQQALFLELRDRGFRVKV